MSIKTLLLKQLGDGYTETRQYLFGSKRVIGGKFRQVGRRAVGVDNARVRIRHPHQLHAAIKILAQFFRDFAPAIIGREHFDDQFRRNIEISRLAQLCRAFVGDIQRVRAANGVWVSSRIDSTRSRAKRAFLRENWIQRFSGLLCEETA